jgi:tetratricopeptide (TPR) repeat protein
VIKLSFKTLRRSSCRSGAPFSRARAGLLLAGALMGQACSRNHIEAINLANEGDQALKNSASTAIKKYEEATRLDPTNHFILAKLARAYQKQEEWDKMGASFARAAQIAPEFANYHYYRGFALIKVAEAGNPDAYEQAKAPLKTCIERDPNFAECYHWLGTAQLWTDDARGAIENYNQAIQKDPTIPYFYPALGEVYLTLRLNDAAEKVLTEGARLTKPIEANANALYGIYTLLSNVYQSKGDAGARLDALKKAEAVAGETHPEIAFNLGSTFAVMKPPQTEQALRLLKSFNKRACAGQAAVKFKDQCTTSRDLVQKLENPTQVTSATP